VTAPSLHHHHTTTQHHPSFTMSHLLLLTTLLLLLLPHTHAFLSLVSNHSSSTPLIPFRAPSYPYLSPSIRGFHVTGEILDIHITSCGQLEQAHVQGKIVLFASKTAQMNREWMVCDHATWCERGGDVIVHSFFFFFFLVNL
jgi:hypothetical protein